MYETVNNSELLTPDAVWRYLGFGAECPTFDELVSHNIVRHPILFHTLTGGQAQEYNAYAQFVHSEPNAIILKQRPFRRYLNGAEQQAVLELQASLTANSPLNLFRNDFHSRLSRLMPLFTNHPPDATFTTYNHILLLLSSASAIVAGAAPRDYAAVGLDTFLQQLSTEPNWMDIYYPFLWDKRNAADDIDFQNFFAHLALPNGLKPLAVYVDEPNAAFLNIEAPGEMPDDPPAASFISRILGFMNEQDRKQAILSWHSVWGEGDASIMSPGAVPEYNFANHLVSWIAYNYQPHIPFAFTDYSIEWVSIFMQTIQHLCIQRLADFACINLHVTQPNQFIVRRYKFAALQPTTRYRQYYPFEALPIMLGSVPLAPFQSLEHMHQVYAQNTITVYHYDAGQHVPLTPSAFFAAPGNGAIPRYAFYVNATNYNTAIAAFAAPNNHILPCIVHPSPITLAGATTQQAISPRDFIPISYTAAQLNGINLRTIVVPQTVDVTSRWFPGGDVLVLV